jgi:hypothetical protein
MVASSGNASSASLHSLQGTSADSLTTSHAGGEHSKARVILPPTVVAAAAVGSLSAGGASRAQGIAVRTSTGSRQSRTQSSNTLQQSKGTTTTTHANKGGRRLAGRGDL